MAALPRFLADENFKNTIVRGVIRRNPDVDIVRVQDVEVSGAADPVVLEWAAREGRVLLTHDVSTMSRYAHERIAAGQRMPGVFQVADGVSIGRIVDELLLIAECSVEGEWEGQVRYLPL